MRKIHLLILLTFAWAAAVAQNAASFSFKAGAGSSYYCSKSEAPVVQTAIELLNKDYHTLFDAEIQPAKIKAAAVVVGTLTTPEVAGWLRKNRVDLADLQGRHEGYLLQTVVVDGEVRLAIIGSDKRGTAYGVMTLLRQMGVSPWQWFADCTTGARASFELPADYRLIESPSVAYRGIFINDEDWGMDPWSSKNYEPSMRALNGEDATPRPGEIGPYTHARIFELLLRLRANTYWPAMHSHSVPFYLVAGNREMAEKYGIVVSTSHCEPMMRNTNGEWKKAGTGDYNFVTNKDNVLRFWEERVSELSDADCIYTLGMRGIHDGAMNGAKTVSEQVAALTQIIAEQRAMLSRNMKRPADEIPQQFVPYKEVLDCYRAGLQVPDDVTLIWCDDNYGYIRHFPTAEEQKRRGGHGMYYHISYWGRPHDYLWLATTPPELVYEEMKRAYDHGVDRIWVLNVGDIKPGEYLTSLFLEMAWDMNRFQKPAALSDFMAEWYGEAFGEIGKKLLPLWQQYYALSFSHRPEFLPGTRIEEKDPKFKQVADLPMNVIEITERLEECKTVEEKLTALSARVPAHSQEAWFQLVEYPMRSMVAMNEKTLGAQLARHRMGGWDAPKAAYDTILALTERYNTLGHGKWRGMMNCSPRSLSGFGAVKEEYFDAPMPEGTTDAVVFNAASCIGQRVELTKPLTVSAAFSGAEMQITVRTLPFHPLNEKTLRYRVAVDGGESAVVDFRTEGRSETWKQNVLGNYARGVVSLPVDSATSKHTITITPIDEPIYVQQVLVKLSPATAGIRNINLGISGPTLAAVGGPGPHLAYYNANPEKMGSAVREGLTPPITPFVDAQVRDAVICVGGDGRYYMTGSTGDDIWRCNDGVELWVSSDLKKWDYMGLVWSFDKDGTWQKPWRYHKHAVRALWAPEIHYVKGNYFITLSMPPGDRGLLKSATGKPEGPYVNALADDAKWDTDIDASLFEDEDGAVYVLYGGGWIARMKEDMSGMAEEPVKPVLTDPDMTPAHHAGTCPIRRNCSDIGHEGAYLFKRDGLYYLTAADQYEGRYSSMVAVSENIYGPYRWRHEAVPCGGGTSYFRDKKGRWWCTYFGNDNQSPFREMPAMVHIDFAKDGHIFPALKQPFLDAAAQKAWKQKWNEVWKNKYK